MLRTQRIRSACFGKILPEDLAFIRNMALETYGLDAKKGALIGDIYRLATANVALGVDELQLAFDPTIQMINPASSARAVVPPEVVGAAKECLTY
jgi:hypothetical protein